MELSAVSDQQSANILFLMSFAESRKLMADSANPKTTVYGWTLIKDVAEGINSNLVQMDFIVQVGPCGSSGITH
jgi:hypothetical protein